MNIQSVLVFGVVLTPIVGISAIVVVAVFRPLSDNAALYTMIGGLIPVTIATLGGYLTTIKTAEAIKETRAEIKEGVAVSGQALEVSNHVNDKIVRLNEDNKNLHKEIKAVLGVAESVKRDTGEHKPLEKTDIAAVATEVVKAIRATGPLAPATGD